ncbi:Planctomycete cytochrome C [Symmachiella macrocystis]|uniref:Planctomycete cytochrome C n=2 Tax=Symmachiella macrocystis TaxID=2527985 RepID=A0A5C6BAA0_9PLAN|nr:Planctomycete cytochrome C [Symmachiella macrocystis]
MRKGVRMMRTCVITVGLLCSFVGQAQAAEPRSVDFNRDVRPILSETCFRCHGPDSAAREADLRLDNADDAFADRGDLFAIVPGEPEKSEAYQRLVADDESLKMPPPDSKLSLTPEQVETLRLWIAQGAKYEKHWSFITPIRPALPAVQQTHWPRNAIDYFVLAQLEERGIAPAPRAARETLIRRLSLDLTGLPPTLDELDAYLADESPEAYEKVVDRLLASPAYGERMAKLWLDGARYADTNGYQNDAERFMWRWRDWVINAYNANMPFDQFTIEQLAGDLLPNATLEQRIATGFNRNHTTSDEGGIIPEEYRVDYVANRLETTSTVWLGLTMGCARCHTHKYDPITQTEYYQLFAFFNNIPEKGKDGDKGNSVPFIKAPTPQQLAEQKRLKGEISEAEKTVAELIDGSAEQRRAWETATRQRWSAQTVERAEATTDDVTRITFDGPDSRITENASLVPAHVTPGLLLTAEAPVALSDVGAFDTSTPFTVSLWLRPSESGHGTLVARRNDKRGYEISLTDKRTVTVRLFHDRAENAIDVSAAGELPTERWSHLAVTYDGSGKAGSVQVYRDGRAEKMDVQQDKLDGTIARSESLVLGTSKTDGPRFRGVVDDLHIFATEQTAEQIQELCAGRGADWDVAPIESVKSKGGATFELRDDGSVFVTGANRQREDYLVKILTERTDLSAIRLEVLRDEQLPKQGPGRGEDGTFHLSEVEAEAVSVVNPHNTQTIHFTAAYADESRDGFDVGKLIDGNVEGKNSWSVKTNSKRSSRNAILVATEPFGFDGGTILKIKLRHQSDVPSRTLGRFRVSLNAQPTAVPGVAEQIAVDLATPSNQRTASQQQRLERHYIGEQIDGGEQALAQLATLQREKNEVEAAIPTTMVMQEMEQPRTAHVLIRGQYDQHGDEVTAGVPASLNPFPADEPRNRLGLARWLTSGEHPLTARVTVNRFWKIYFGTGLVKTDEDFGAQGEWPVHIDLLDWLATEFVQNGWDIKALQKTIVMSAAYQQDARVGAELLKIDPHNRLISRGPRFRMSAEMIRDNALAVSGLLVKKIGGPSVKPYQPPGLWKEVSSGVVRANLFEQDHGDNLYRRSLYTFWKRAAPPPALQTFDAPTREYCVTNRSRTNTPLQALILMNDVTYVEAARVFAQRLMNEGPQDSAGRITRAFRLAVGRKPSRYEIVVLLKLLKSRMSYYRTHGDAATELLSVGEAPLDETVSSAELAAWTNIASLILCLDESITKG